MKKGMVNLALVLLVISFSGWSYGQTTVVLQPGPAAGKDAVLMGNAPGTNAGNSDEFISYYWTFSGSPAPGFSLLEFDLTFLPSNVQIESAYLMLYYNATSSSAGQAGDNACYLKKVTAPWDENTVTWNTLPATTTMDQVYLATSTSSNQSYPDIDVTDFVADWYNNPTTNYGMMLEMIDLSLYNSMKFCSSDYSDSLLRPRLVITYLDSVTTDTCVIWQPGPSGGIDAALLENNPSVNSGSSTEFISYYWTFSGSPSAGFSLLRFDLSFLPPNIQVNSANLSLYHNSTSSSDGQAGDNACYLKKVTAPWSETTVTWNTMPPVSTTDQVYLATSTSATQNYPNIDITDFVTDWYNNPSANYGMMLELIDQSLYNSMKFCSSDCGDALLRPRLEVCYTVLDAGIEELNDMNVSIFPNPGNGSYSIRFNDGSVTGQVSLQVYSISGQLVYENSVVVSSGDQPEKIDLSNCDPGLYVVRIVADQAMSTHNIVLE